MCGRGGGAIWNQPRGSMGGGVGSAPCAQPFCQQMAGFIPPAGGRFKNAMVGCDSPEFRAGGDAELQGIPNAPTN